MVAMTVALFEARSKRMRELAPPGFAWKLKTSPDTPENVAFVTRESPGLKALFTPGVNGKLDIAPDGAHDCAYAIEGARHATTSANATAIIRMIEARIGRLTALDASADKAPRAYLTTILALP